MPRAAKIPLWKRPLLGQSQAQWYCHFLHFPLILKLNTEVSTVDEPPTYGHVNVTLPSSSSSPSSNLLSTSSEEGFAATIDLRVIVSLLHCLQVISCISRLILIMFVGKQKQQLVLQYGDCVATLQAPVSSWTQIHPRQPSNAFLLPNVFFSWQKCNVIFSILCSLVVGYIALW